MTGENWERPPEWEAFNEFHSGTIYYKAGMRRSTRWEYFLYLLKTPIRWVRGENRPDWDDDWDED